MEVEGRSPCRATSSTRRPRRWPRTPAGAASTSTSRPTSLRWRRPCTWVDGRSGTGWRSSRWKGATATLDGSPDELTVRRYERFGAGGAKLIWGEAAAVVPEARANTRQLVVDEAHAAGLARLVEVCRAYHRAEWGDDSDLLIGLQLTHSGRYSVPRPILAQHDPLLDPRTVMDRASGARAGPDTPLISDEALDRLQDRYVSAAGVAFKARLRLRRHQAVPSLLPQRAACLRRRARASTAVRSRTARGSSATSSRG